MSLTPCWPGRWSRPEPSVSRCRPASPPRVAVNRRAVTRFGCCIRRGGEYVIELSERLLEAEERACMQTLAHEVLHTCPGCRNHGALWKEYAARMNGAYGYAISRTGTCEALGVADVRPVRYRLV